MIIQQQPPATSAVFRDLFPDKYDRTKILDRLETLALLTVRSQMLLGNQANVDTTGLPSTWDEIWSDPERTETTELLTFEQIDERMGWAHEAAHEIELLTTDEIDERMGW